MSKIISLSQNAKDCNSYTYRSIIQDCMYDCMFPDNSNATPVKKGPSSISSTPSPSSKASPSSNSGGIMKYFSPKKDNSDQTSPSKPTKRSLENGDDASPSKKVV